MQNLRIFNRDKTMELQLADVNLEKGRLRSDRITTKDADGKAVTEHILVYQPEPDAKIAAEMRLLKAFLANTDYKAIKYAEGELSAEDYAQTKVNRKAWRKRIRELEALIAAAEV